MEIRLLQSGEEPLWLSLKNKKNFSTELEAFLARRKFEDPRGFVVAADKGRIVARLYSFFPTTKLCVMRRVVVNPTHDFSSITRQLMDFVNQRCADCNIEAMTCGEPEESGFEAELDGYGFRIYMQKAFVERQLDDWRYPYHERLTYRSLAEAGEEAFIRVLAEIYKESVIRDLGKPEEDLRNSIEFAGPAFYPKNWFLASFEGEEVGVVYPQIYHDEILEGSIFFIGVVPKFRGRGFGRLLHAEGLEALKARGATRYIGSTDVLNEPMLKIFEAHGCRTVNQRRHFRRSQGS